MKKLMLIQHVKRRKKYLRKTQWILWGKNECDVTAKHHVIITLMSHHFVALRIREISVVRERK